MTALLDVKDLRVSFRQDGQLIPAVRGVSFAVNRGETVALVGESGSGKSVSALSTVSLLGDSARVSGSVTYDGQEMIGADDKLLHKVRGNDISFIFQEPMTSLNPLHTIEKQLAESLALHQGLQGAEARARVLSLLEQVGINDAESRMGAYPHQLSGGQRQRVMIAMALANKPDILIADEPTTALDVTIQSQILKLMRRQIVEKGASMILVTHDLAVVSEMADHITVLYCGNVVERGCTRELIEAPAHPYTRGLIDSIPDLSNRHERLTQIPGTVPDIRNLPKGCNFRDRCPRAQAICGEVEPTLTAQRGSLSAACHFPLSPGETA